jgi:flagellar hook-associated protein 3 FlgL
MRVSSNLFSNNFLTQLNQLQSRQLQLQNQAATGQKITLPEDDPAAMQHVLDLQADARATTQYQSNISQLTSTATAGYNVINGLKTISDRAGEISTLADGTKSPQDLAAYATEVNQLIDQAVSLANTKYQGNYLLSGTATNTQPFVTTTDANGQVTAVTYQGNAGASQVEIAPNVTVSAQVPGANTSGSGARGLITDSRSGADFINHLISLRDNLQAANTAAIKSTDVPQLAKDEDNILYHITANGAMQSRLQATGTLLDQHSQSVDSQISQATNADLAQTLTQFSMAQTAYQAALQSGAAVLGNSLLDFLH